MLLKHVNDGQIVRVKFSHKKFNVLKRKILTDFIAANSKFFVEVYLYLMVVCHIRGCYCIDICDTHCIAEIKFCE